MPPTESLPTAGSLVLNLRVTGDTLRLGYEIDGRAPSEIRISYPPGVEPACQPRALDLIAAAAAVYVGSLALATRIRVERPLPAHIREAFTPLTEMLYRIRCWKDRRPLMPTPELEAPLHDGLTDSPSELDSRHSALLWSGGKDSTLALLTLEANGYRVSPAHVSANAGVEDLERRATADLAAALGVEAPETVGYEHADFLPLTRLYSAPGEWDEFPLANRIPFGRDLLLAALVIPFALSRGSAVISLGHDNECRNATVDYEGITFPRNDLESAEGAAVLEAIMREHVHPDLRLLPPVANLSELRILRDMFSLRPDLMPATAFCFWDWRCGRCAKCLRYYLADQLYGGGILRFDRSPLEQGACPELDDIFSPVPRSTLFQREVLVMLARVAQRGGTTADQPVIRSFVSSILPRIERELDSWEASLMAARSDPQVPPDFQVYADAATTIDP